MIEYDKNDPNIVYVDGKRFTREEHEKIVQQFLPPEGEDFDYLKPYSSLTEEEKANLTPKQKQLYDTKEPAGYRKKK